MQKFISISWSIETDGQVNSGHGESQEDLELKD